MPLNDTNIVYSFGGLRSAFGTHPCADVRTISCTVVMQQRPKSDRWAKWDNPDCDSGCKIEGCGGGETPCCVNSLSTGGVYECPSRSNLTYSEDLEHSVMIDAEANLAYIVVRLQAEAYV